MKALRWIWVAVGLLMLPGCGGGRLVPEDIAALLRSETGRLALKAVEAHGGIWRWRARPLAQFDHMIFETARGMDTVIENRGRDTTITPRVDTLTNVRENCILDLVGNRKYSRSASQSPLLVAGFNGDSVWSLTNGAPDSALALARAGRHLDELSFLFRLPFSLVDTTLKLSLPGDLKQVDTVITKGREAGTFDTTITELAISRLKVEWAGNTGATEWTVFYLDGRNGQVRRTLSPVVRADGSRSHRLTIWSDMVDAIGLKVGGRRLSYPSTEDGQITGPYEHDRRFYNVEFPRALESEPFNWTPGQSATVSHLPSGSTS